MPADDLPVYLELTGLTGELIPGNTAAPPVTDYESRPCTADRPVEEDEPLAAVRAFDAFAYGDPRILWCGNELLTPPSIARGICERCWIDNGRGANRFNGPQLQRHVVKPKERTPMNRHATLVHHRAWQLILTVATGNEDADAPSPVKSAKTPTPGTRSPTSPPCRWRSCSTPNTWPPKP